MDAPLQRDALGDERVDVQRFELHRRLAGKLREGAHAPLERLDLAHHDLRGLIDEGAVGRLPGLHLLDRQSDRRQRVLQLVRGLARERLPARHLGQVDEPLAALPQLIGHAVERVDRACRLHRARLSLRSPPVRARRDQSPAANAVSAAGELLDRPADPVRDEDERRERHEPRCAEQQEQRQREAAPQVAALDRFHQLAGLPQLGRQLLHPDAARGRG